MPAPSTILIDDKRYRWKDLVQLRREQRAAARRATQLELFDDLPEDSRPAYERTASGRYQQPSLFTLLADDRRTEDSL
jgi:hypothetical protein